MHASRGMRRHCDVTGEVVFTRRRINVSDTQVHQRFSPVSDSYDECGSRIITSVTATCHRDTPPEKDRT